MEKHILSKSTFIKGHQCLKALYLHKKRSFLRDKLSPEQLAKFKRGHKVGDMAQEIFPGGIDVSPKSPSQYQKSVIQTQELIAEGQTIIYEATFQYNKVLVMLDILVKTEKGWEAYEVKSSRRLSETYFTDAALQYYVITNSGLDLATFSLVYVNENYRLQEEGNIDVDQYFIKQEVSAEIIAKQAEIAEEIESELQILTELHSPKIEVGSHCFSPYSCDFFGFCWKKRSTDLFKLPALSKAERTDLLNKQILSLEDLRNEKWNNPLAEKQLNSLITNEPFISNNLKVILSTLPVDTAYLGFVSRQAAIPYCMGDKPYQNQLLSYSFITDQTKQALLFSGKCDDYAAFVEHFIQELISTPKIVVYDKEHLTELLKQVAEFFPALSSRIEQIIAKVWGIKQWILEGEFYFPGLKYDLIFKDTLNRILNITPFAGKPLSADVLAVNMFVQINESTNLFDATNEDKKAILTYVEHIAIYTQELANVLKQ